MFYFLNREDQERIKWTRLGFFSSASDYLRVYEEMCAQLEKHVKTPGIDKKRAAQQNANLEKMADFYNNAYETVEVLEGLYEDTAWVYGSTEEEAAYQFWLRAQQYAMEDFRLAGEDGDESRAREALKAWQVLQQASNYFGSVIHMPRVVGVTDYMLRLLDPDNKNIETEFKL